MTKMQLDLVDVPKLKTYNKIIALRERSRKWKNQLIDVLLSILLRIVYLASLVAFIFGTAILIYFVILYSSLPTMRHVFPVYLQHSDCSSLVENCLYPNATVPFREKHSHHKSPLLMPGQKYSMNLLMELPESEVEHGNLKMGTFMVHISLRSHHSKVVAGSTRGALLQYRSLLHRILRLTFLSPLYIAGILEEEQRIIVELFDSYQEDSYNPVMDAFVEIRKSLIEVYRTELVVEAQLEGFRLWMHRHPVLIGLVIVFVNFITGSVLIGVAVYHRYSGSVRGRIQGAPQGAPGLPDQDHVVSSSRSDKTEKLESGMNWSGEMKFRRKRTE